MCSRRDPAPRAADTSLGTVSLCRRADVGLQGLPPGFLRRPRFAALARGGGPMSRTEGADVQARELHAAGSTMPPRRLCWR